MKIKEKMKILVVCGPTATGKSDLAVKLAKRFNGEVISADSRQVYKGLDIATGKITKKEMMGIHHHLLSIVSPKKQFTASDFVEIGRKKIEEIISRHKLPIICGGTGFYISALLGEISLSDVPPNIKLRKSLLGNETSKLVEILRKLNPERLKTIDQKNPVRLIRAIEIASTPNLETKHPSWGWIGEKYKVLKIGLTLPSQELRKRIHLRLLKRLKMGMISEAKKLHQNGLSYKRMDELGLEYRYLAKYLNSKITKKELIKKLNTEIWRYAKRQITWFKRDKEIGWVSPGDNLKVIKIIAKFL